MKVAGLGFRAAATTESLLAALRAASGEDAAALATLSDKAQATALIDLAAALGVPIIPISAAALTNVKTFTQSPRQLATLGAGSLAEAAALIAAGPGARLLGPRATAPDGMATAAIATAAIPEVS